MFVALLAACGSDGGSDTTPAPVNVTTTVIDGPLANALVCLDENRNGACDSGEIQGRTAADGKVTLAVPADKAGQFPLVAVVGTDAVDSIYGPVTSAYTLTTPADQTTVVTPLTTLVQRVVADTGVTSSAAASQLQAALGLATSPLADYFRAEAADAATVARLIVVTQQQQLQALAPTVGTNAIDGQPISAADLQRLVERTLVQMAQPLAAAAGDPAVRSATGAAQASAIAAAATQLVGTEGVAAAGAATAVAAGRQAPGADPAAAPGAALQVVSLTYTDSANWFVRALTSSAAQATPDGENKTRYVDRRMRSVSGHIGTWSTGIDPTRNSDLHWNGSDWVACGINFESKSTVRTAAGFSQYEYCGGRETGSSQRSTFDVGGQSMATVIQQARDAGYTNITVPAEALGSAAFPAGSKVSYQTNTPATMAVTYIPGGADAPAGTTNRVTQYSTEVANGGNVREQAAGTGCNAPEAAGSGSHATTLEALIAVKQGKPCILNPGTLTYQGATYSSGPDNVWWGNSTVSLGRLGSAPLNSGPAPGYFTTNTLLRVAFAASGNGVTYYACQERFLNGSPRNCKPLGTGTYTITPLGNARALSFSNLPAQSAGLTFERVLVEREGTVFFGFRSKPTVTNSLRLNLTASAALLAQLALPAVDPEQPFATTAGSFVGTWDFRGSTEAVGTPGTTVTIAPNGGVTCLDRAANRALTCTLTIDNPATGAFSYSDAAGTASGSFAFVAGTAGGTFSDTSPPATGTFVGSRR